MNNSYNDYIILTYSFTEAFQSKLPLIDGCKKSLHVNNLLKIKHYWLIKYNFLQHGL